MPERSFGFTVLYELLPPDARRVAFVGLAKNAGKTTALRGLVSELVTEGLVPGLLSVGIDGEARDAISGAAKPSIPVACNTLVATSDVALRRSTCAADVLRATGVRSAMGELVVARVRRDGEVVLAGVRHRSDVIRVGGALLEEGADRVVIDGAFDRVAAASPLASDAVIVSTGASVGGGVDEIAAASAELVGRLRLPAWSPAADAAAPVHRVSGLLADAALAELAARTPPGATIVVPDATHVICSRQGMVRFQRARSIAVERPIRVAVVTTNPWRLEGGLLSARALAEAVAERLPDVPVVDVVAGILING